jgi:hypothetical protein
VEKNRHPQSQITNYQSQITNGVPAVDFRGLLRRVGKHEKGGNEMGAEWNKVIDNALLRISIIVTGFGLWLATLYVLLGL